MAGLNHSFNHFLRTGHFISDNTPVTHSQLNLMLSYIKKNPTFYNSRLPHQSITIVAKPTSDKVSEKDCPICTKSISMKLEESEKALGEKLEEADNKLEEKFKACEEKIDKLYQSAERFLLFGAQTSSLATSSKNDRENKQSSTHITPLFCNGETILI